MKSASILCLFVPIAAEVVDLDDHTRVNEFFEVTADGSTIATRAVHVPRGSPSSKRPGSISLSQGSSADDPSTPIHTDLTPNKAPCELNNCGGKGELCGSGKLMEWISANGMRRNLTNQFDHAQYKMYLHDLTNCVGPKVNKAMKNVGFNDGLATKDLAGFECVDDASLIESSTTASNTTGGPSCKEFSIMFKRMLGCAAISTEIVEMVHSHFFEPMFYQHGIDWTSLVINDQLTWYQEFSENKMIGMKLNNSVTGKTNSSLNDSRPAVPLFFTAAAVTILIAFHECVAPASGAFGCRNSGGSDMWSLVLDKIPQGDDMFEAENWALAYRKWKSNRFAQLGLCNHGVGKHAGIGVTFSYLATISCAPTNKANKRFYTSYLPNVGNYENIKAKSLQDTNTFVCANESLVEPYLAWKKSLPTAANQTQTWDVEKQGGACATIMAPTQIFIPESVPDIEADCAEPETTQGSAPGGSAPQDDSKVISSYELSVMQIGAAGQGEYTEVEFACLNCASEGVKQFVALVEEW
jgi:hypothetical protein